MAAVNFGLPEESFVNKIKTLYLKDQVKVKKVGRSKFNGELHGQKRENRQIS